jgi:phosphoglycolate phosphatase
VSGEPGTPVWYLYLLETASGALYTGITTDVERRLAEHAAGRGAKALRGRGPLTLRHSEPVGSHGEALRREAEIKRFSATRKRAWLAARQPVQDDQQRRGASMHPILDGIELVAFDLDGTLIDSVPDLALAVDAALADLGLPAAGEARVRDWVGNGSLVLMERALRHTTLAGSGEADPATDLRGGAVNPSLGATDAIPGIGPPLRSVPGASPDGASRAIDTALLERAHAAFLTHYGRDPGAHTRLYPGVRECLDALRERGLPLALVTNKPYAFIAPLLEGLGLAEHFALCLGGDSLPEKKPHPAPLLHVASHFGLPPQACLMVGDSRHDIAAGQAAGFRTLAVPYGYNHGEPVRESGPDGVVESLMELV